MGALLQDVRYGLRMLARSPGFTVAAIATLALGIGATSAVFTVVNGVLLRPLPYGDPDRLAMVWLAPTGAQGPGTNLPLSTGFYLDLKEQTEAFRAVAAFRAWPYTVASEGPAEQVPGARVSPVFFEVLGVAPLLGRTFTDEQARPGSAHVVVISHSYWQRRFGGSVQVLGQSMVLSGEPFTIVGVMPPGFAFPRGAELRGGLRFAERTDLWTPLVIEPGDERNHGTLNLAGVARLAPGVTHRGAATQLTETLHGWLAENGSREKLDYRVINLQEQAGGPVRRSLLVLMGAVGFVLLIACANITNLLIARTAARERELAVRAAFGAGRARIARQLVTENILLTLAGTGLGLLASSWGVRAMLALVPGSMPRVDDVAMDGRVIALALAVALGAGLAFGIATAYHVHWEELQATLQAATSRATGGHRRRLGRRMLVVAEISLSLMLVIGAAELTRSFLRLQRVEPGFLSDHTLAADVQLPIPNGFHPLSDGPRWREFFGQLMDRLNAAPGIAAAGGVSSIPLSAAEETTRVAIVGQPAPEGGMTLPTQYNVVSGRYFEAMRIELLAGRAFDTRDASDAQPVILVNREFVHRYFADAPAVGAQLTTGIEFMGGAPARTIVGVVGNVLQTSLDSQPSPQVYVPQAQLPYPALTVMLRTSGDPVTAVEPLRSAVRSLDAVAAVARVRTLDEVFSSSLARQRFSATIIVAFAGAALALAMVGLYGVIALSVGQRHREIGVRMALGARAPDVLRLLLGEGVRITLLAIGLGLVGAFATTRALETLVYGANARETWVFAAAALAVALVSITATYLPARRALRVSPTVALRGD